MSKSLRQSSSQSTMATTESQWTEKGDDSKVSLRRTHHAGARPKDNIERYAKVHNNAHQTIRTKLGDVVVSPNRTVADANSASQNDKTVGRFRDSATAETRTVNRNSAPTQTYYITIKVRTAKSSREHKESIESSFDDYMKWKYTLNSPTNLCKCNTHLGEVEGDVKLNPDSLLVIASEVRDLAHVQMFVKAAIEIVLRVGNTLQVDTFVIKDDNAPQCIEALSSSKFSSQENMYVEKIDKGIICLVYEKSSADAMKSHFANLIGQELRPVECELETRVTMDTIWEKMSLKIGLKNKLEEHYPMVSIRFEPSSSAFVCHLKGPGMKVAKAAKMLKNYKEKLQCKRCIFSENTRQHLYKLNVGEKLDTYLNEKVIGCLVEQVQNEVIVYGFDEETLKLAVTEVSKCISERSVLVTGSWREAAKIEELKSLISDSQPGKIVLHYCEGARLYIVGFNDAVIEAESDVKGLLNYVEETFVVDTNEQFIVLKVMTPNISSTYNVRISLLDNHKVKGFLLYGFDSNVQLAKKAMNEAKKNTCFDIISVPSMFTTSGTDALQQIERTYGVLIEHQPNDVADSMEDVSSAQNAYANNMIWPVSQHHKVVLLKDSIAACGANVVVCTQLGTSLTEGISRPKKMEQFTEVDIMIPRWVDGNSNEEHTLEDLIGKVLTKVSEYNEEAVAISVEPLTTWPYDTYFECITHAILRFFHDASKNVRPRFVQLVTNNTDTFQKASRLLSNAASGKREPCGLKITIKSGELNMIQADVLVNTTAPSLDLSHGRVSAALMKSAGSDIQKECTKRYPNGIGRGDIAVTGGYKLKCHQVYHGAFAKYRQGNEGDCLQDLRRFMTTCLKSASSNNYKSIAFPVIGTGNLRYPVDLVASEMFINVEKFRKKYETTSLEDVIFVVFPADQETLRIFKKMESTFEAQEKKPQGLQLRIIGTKANVRKAKAHLKQIIEQPDINKVPNISAASTNEATGKTNTKPLKPSHGTTSSDIQNAQSLYKPVVQRSFSWSTCAKNLKVYQAERMVIKVYEADILQLPVECIVNAANGDLHHLGGIAYTIARAAGDDFDKESQNIISMYGRLNVGSVVTTMAGRLHYKYVIHAVGPCWSDYSPITKDALQRCEDDLYNAVLSSLKEAERLHLKSVALPAISSAIFGVPKEICSVQYAKAVKAFCAHQYYLQEVHFVDLDHEIINTIRYTFNVMLVDNKPAPYSVDVYIQQPSTAKLKPTARGRPVGLSTVGHKGPAYSHIETKPFLAYDEDSGKLCCSLTKYHIIMIYTDDILTVDKVDAIVCSEDMSGRGSGMVAKKLAEIGRNDYLSEKEKAFAGRPQFGDIVITGGGKSKYKCIIHALVPHKDPVAILALFEKIFEEAVRQSFASIAMSLLGTGSALSGPSEIAEMLFKSYSMFCRRNADKELLVHMVNTEKSYTDIVVRVFKDKIDQSTHSLNINQSPVQGTIGSLQQRMATGPALPSNSNETDHRKEYIHDGTSRPKEMNAKDNVDDVNVRAQADNGNETKSLPVEKIEDNCVICMDKFDNPKKLKCGHVFCTDCIDQYFKVKQACPTCGVVCGVITGDQPTGGMEIMKIRSSVAGYPEVGAIAVTYSFPDGKQESNHPRPGTYYRGITRTGYLPDNDEGRTICVMLRVAFNRKLVFTVGTSRTTGQEGVITWNDIHHKTDPRPNTQFGYPDETYLARVTDELGAKGVMESDIDPEFMKKLKSLSGSKRLSN